MLLSVLENYFNKKEDLILIALGIVPLRNNSTVGDTPTRVIDAADNLVAHQKRLGSRRPISLADASSKNKISALAKRFEDSMWTEAQPACAPNVKLAAGVAVWMPRLTIGRTLRGTGDAVSSQGARHLTMPCR